MSRGRSGSPRPAGGDGDVDMDTKSDKSPKSRSHSPAKKTGAKVVVVTNLTRNICEAHLQTIFGFYGTISKVDLPVYPKTGQSRGKAALEYADPDSAEKAVDHMDGGHIDGFTVKAELSDLPIRSRSKSPPFRGPRNDIADVVLHPEILTGGGEDSEVGADATSVEEVAEAILEVHLRARVPDLRHHTVAGDALPATLEVDSDAEVVQELAVSLSDRAVPGHSLVPGRAPTDLTPPTVVAGLAAAQSLTVVVDAATAAVDAVIAVADEATVATTFVTLAHAAVLPFEPRVLLPVIECFALSA